MTRKRILALVLAICMVLSTMGTVAFAETTEADVWDGTIDISWYNEEDKEFTITTAEQWAGFAYLVNGVQTFSPAMDNQATADLGYYTEGHKKYEPSEEADAQKSISFEGKTIKLGADLDFCAVDENGELIRLPGDELLSMMPVGFSIYTPFKGNFDGQGHTIKNIFQGMWDAIGHPSYYEDYVSMGIFGNVEDATIKNLTIDNITFNVECRVGGLIGMAGGTSSVEDITVKNSVISSNAGWRIGGLIGWAYGNMTIKNISIDETNTVGAVGGNYDASVGGIIGGCNNVDGESITFENCDVSCKLDVFHDNVANYNTGVYRNCGMVIGAIGEGTDEDRYEVVIDGVRYPDFKRKGLTFENINVTFGDWANYTYCWSYEVDKNCQRVEPGISYNGVDVSNLKVYEIELVPFNALFGAENAVDPDDVRGKVDLEVIELLDKEEQLEAESFAVTEPKILDGEGTEEDPYVINNLDDLKKFRDAVNAGVTYAGEYVLLTDDIDLSGEVWTPIGISNYDKTPDEAKMFAGNFDGGNHTISGLTSEGFVPSADETGSTEYSFGLFGYVYGSNISNVKMADVDINCGTTYDTAGNEVAGSGIAALIGYYFPADGKVSVIENCHVLSGSVNASNNMGGLIGHMDSQISQPKVDITIRNCSNAANVTTEAREAGGILGLMNSARTSVEYLSMRGRVVFENCTNTGDITSLGGGAPSAGGILGRDHNQDSWQLLDIIFDGCKNSGTITVTANGETHAAGIGAGFYSHGARLISKNSRNTGDVVVLNPGNDVYAGGLISYGGVVELIDSTSTGTVTGGTAGNKYIGGVASILFLEGMYDYTDTVGGCTYFLNGGVAPERQYLIDDSGNYNFNPVEIAYKDGFEFGYWYDNANFEGKVYDATTNLRQETARTFYAKWIGTVAKIGDDEYDSLEEAFAAAEEGETITLMADAAPVLKSQRAITKAATIDLNGNKITLTEDDLYFGTTTFKNGEIVVAPIVKASTAVFWMFKDQTLTFDNVKLTASGVSGTYLIGLDGDNSDLNLLNGSEIIVDNDEALDLDIICVNASTGNDIVVDDSKVSVTNLDGRVFFRGNYTISGNSDIDLKGITKAGFRIEAGQTLNIMDTVTIDIEGEPRDGGIHITELPATLFKADTATVNATWNLPASAAKIGDTQFATLQAAVNAANYGDVVELSKNVAESVIAKAPEAANGMRSTPSAVTIDLNNFTLTGDITIKSDATVVIENGTITNTNSRVSAVQSYGTTTLVDVDVTSARHAVRVENGVTTIKGGNYKVGTAGMTTHAVNVSDGGRVIIEDGVFEGPAKTAASDSGSAVNVQSGSTATINGGKFSGGKLSTLAVASDGALVVNEGMFDQDVTAYIAETSEAIDRGAYDYRYGVAPKAASKISVTLEETDNENVYDIVINSDGEYDIYEFVSAELTFANNSTTVGGSVMDYEIKGYKANKTFAQKAKNAKDLADNEEQYVISLSAGADRLSGDGIIIGQVEFFGQGDIDFSITKGEIDTTWQNTNLGRYYVNDGDDTTTDDTVVLGEDASINTYISEIHRDVAVNIAFNHNIDTANYWNGYQITATLKNNAMDYEVTKDITIADIKSGACVFPDVPVGYITVTLKAPGFRTYTHNTTLEETEDNGVLVLNFWNDVKRGNDEVIEEGKAEMAHNFLVGDIVMDMKVDKYDLAAVTSYYGMYGLTDADKYIKYDLNRDGNIDIRDVQYVLHTMGN